MLDYHEYKKTYNAQLFNLHFSTLLTENFLVYKFLGIKSVSFYKTYLKN